MFLIGAQSGAPPRVVLHFMERKIHDRANERSGSYAVEHHFARCTIPQQLKALDGNVSAKLAHKKQTHSVNVLLRELHASVLPGGLGHTPLCHGKHQENTTTNAISLLRHAGVRGHHSLSPCPGAPPSRQLCSRQVQESVQVLQSATMACSGGYSASGRIKDSNRLDCMLPEGQRNVQPQPVYIPVVVRNEEVLYILEHRLSGKPRQKGPR